MAPLAPYVDTSAAHLGLTLLRGRLDVAQFTCFDQMRLQDDSIFVELTVIGASHVLTFGRQGTVLSELLACVPPPTEEALFSKAPGTLQEGDFQRTAGALQWKASVRRLQTQSAPAPVLLGQEGARMVETWFPARAHRPPPLTRLEARLAPRPGVLAEVATLHWYESESVAVTSSTVIADCASPRAGAKD